MLRQFCMLLSSQCLHIWFKCFLTFELGKVGSVVFRQFEQILLADKFLAQGASCAFSLSIYQTFWSNDLNLICVDLPNLGDSTNPLHWNTIPSCLYWSFCLFLILSTWNLLKIPIKCLERFHSACSWNTLILDKNLVGTVRFAMLC